VGSANIVDELGDIALGVLPVMLVAEPDAGAVEPEALGVAQVPLDGSLIARPAVAHTADKAVVVKGFHFFPS